jgi:zinc/manganese transport system substrate-binding protein
MRLHAVPAAVLLLSAACSSGGPPSSGPLAVVAGENFWGSIAAQIGGSHVHVTSIVTDPSADPHLYESSAQDAAAVSEARVVIENGAGYDDFLDKLLSATGGSNRSVVNVQSVLGSHGSDVNPHFWYDVPRVPEVASAIEAALARADAADAAGFRAGLATFDEALQPVEQVLERIRARHAAAPVAYTERVPEYLLDAAGLDVKTPPGFAAAIEAGNDPSPGDTAAMDRLITTRGVAVLIYNAQTVSPVTENVQSLARAAGVRVVAVTETLPPAYHRYQDWQLAQAQAILRALGG